MIGWLIFGAYAFGWLLSARMMAVSMIEKDAQRELRSRRFGEDEGEPLVDTEGRVLSICAAAFTCLAWPVVLIVMGVSRTLRAPSEKAYADRLELEKLRAQAKAYGLPFGDEKEGKS